MSVAKIIELSADSSESFEAAVAEGVRKASQTVANIQSAWVKDQEVLVDANGNIDRYRVHLKVTFALK